MSLDTTLSDTNQIWSYYKKCYDELSGEYSQKVECLTCSKQLMYKSSDYKGGLWRHLKNSHGLIREPTEKPAPQAQAPVIESTSVPKKTVVKAILPSGTRKVTKPEVLEKANASIYKTVPLYRYFTLYKNGRARCRVCMSAALPTSLLRSEANCMLSHLKTHPRAYKLYELETEYGKSGPEFDESVHMPETSTQSIFTIALDGRYQCQICQSTFPGRNEMQKHLKQKHPTISEQDIGNDVVYTEIVFVGGDRDKTRTVNKRKFSEKDPKFMKKKNAGQDVDAFAQYVTTLLKEMPKEDSTKLQQTILNKIIAAKLNANTRRTSKNKEEDEIYAVVTKTDHDFTDTGHDSSEVMTEEYLEPIEEEPNDSIDDDQEQPTVYKRFKYKC